MAKYKYIGEPPFFIPNGGIINADESDFTTWSIRKPNGDREIVKMLYIKNAGFNGEDMPINTKNLEQIKQQADGTN